MKFLQSLVLLAGIVLFSACGGPKIVPATPVNNTVSAAQSTQELHEMMVLLAKYKKYTILSDNGQTQMRIKYSRLSGKTAESVSSITYDVTNDANSYTMSYADSENFGYQNGQISSTYIRYINMFDTTLKRMYDDPDYLARMKVIVANPNIQP